MVLLSCSNVCCPEAFTLTKGSSPCLPHPWLSQTPCRKSFFPSGATAQPGPGPPHSWCFYITHNDTPQSVGLLCTSDRPVAADLHLTQHNTHNSRNSPYFMEPWRFITAFTRSRHLPARSIQSLTPSHSSNNHFNIILYLPSGFIRSGFPTKTLYAPLFSPIRVTCSAHLILLDFITRIRLSGEKHRAWRYLLCSLLHSPVISSLSGSNNLENTQYALLSQYERSRFTPIYNDTTELPLLQIVHVDRDGVRGLRCDVTRSKHRLTH